ncbi:hypothetical protein COB11_05055 [Candidatus Aerophobetes bacterium]|uniref:Uncharacterized protein n=1 Tax=Aerophobetes bacterium TaxID=2030807 RepID=A0A2A4YGW6_UNCAE|nr:MAG: hypothetical protein COB11_05055 [Candidatus Aerophobetes bacterium]
MNIKLTICLTARTVSGWIFSMDGDSSCDHSLTRLSVDTEFETKELPLRDPNSFTCFEINVAEEISKRLKAKMTLVATNLNKVIPTIFFDEDNTLSPLMALKDPFSTMSSPRVGDFYSKEPLSLSNHSKPMQIDGKYTIPLVYDEEEALLFPRIEDSNQYFATPIRRLHRR